MLIENASLLGEIGRLAFLLDLGPAMARAVDGGLAFGPRPFMEFACFSKIDEIAHGYPAFRAVVDTHHRADDADGRIRFNSI